MKPSRYESAARALAYLIARIEATAHAATPRERQARTRAVNALAQRARALAERNRKATP